MISMNEKYCCYDCRFLKYPFEVDETEMPIPTNPYCKKRNDIRFLEPGSSMLDWQRFDEYDKHICKDFKLSWWIRLHLRKTFKEEQEEREEVWKND